MNKNIIFFSLIFSCPNILISSQKKITDKKHISFTRTLSHKTDYSFGGKILKSILPDIFFSTCGHDVYHASQPHQFLFSNTYNSKILTCFSRASDPKNNTFSIIDLSSSSQYHYRSNTINTEDKVSAIHLLNDTTIAVGQTKFVHILKDETNKYLYFLSHFFTSPHPTNLLTEKFVLDPNLDIDDSIHTIESSRSHFVVVSNKGFISIWKKESIDPTQKFTKIRFQEAFDCCTINQKNNTLILKLKNNKIRALDLINLTLSDSVDTSDVNTFQEGSQDILINIGFDLSNKYSFVRRTGEIVHILKQNEPRTDVINPTTYLQTHQVYIPNNFISKLRYAYYNNIMYIISSTPYYVTTAIILLCGINLYTLYNDKNI